eukprot:gb/GFBE01074698.1/.p1 GENE.gb/GFBE01074698.1/~~gb/GFBE01074698.1/.p1  ORF type:complete len:345 (+),score=45.73 gb/GFBE01074698.1/:1-1035(+)
MPFVELEGPPAKRLRAWSDDDVKSTKSTVVHIPALPSRSPLGARSRKKGSTDEKALQGVNEDLERPYVRFTNLPRASDIRPVRVLRRAFDLVKERWAQQRDWVWAGEMLRSIRQDLKVQMIRSPFAVEVYEFFARTALEMGDYKQFDQCSTLLEDLHDDATLKASTNKPEFLAYRLLYLSLAGDGALAMSGFLRRHGVAIRKAASSGDPYLGPAWSLRSAMSSGPVPRKVSFGAEVSMPYKALYLRLLEGSELHRLVAFCRASRPAPARAAVARLGLEKGPRENMAVAPDDATPAWPHVPGRPDASRLDAAATAAAAEQRLATKLGVGRKSAAHAKSFVRVVTR